MNRVEGNQNVATLTPGEASVIRAEIVKSSVTSGADGGRALSGAAIYYSDDVGSVYLIQLEPGHDPGRFKAGFTTDLEDACGSTVAPQLLLSTYVRFRPNASGSERRLTV